MGHKTLFLQKKKKKIHTYSTYIPESRPVHGTPYSGPWEREKIPLGGASVSFRLGPLLVRDQMPPADGWASNLGKRL